MVIDIFLVLDKSKRTSPEILPTLVQKEERQERKQQCGVFCTTAAGCPGPSGER